MKKEPLLFAVRIGRQIMLCLALNVMVLFSLAQTNENWCHSTLTNSSGFAPTSFYSPYGGVFTPKGDLRALIIYAGFGSADAGQPLDEWPTNPPSNSTIPNYVNPVTGASTDVFFNSTTDFTTIAVPSNTTNTSISRFYYDMSKNTFRFMADVLKNPATGLPVRININTGGLSSWEDCNKAVLNKMKTQYPTFNWAPYDNRTNWPYFQYDGSTSAPDMKPDFVVIIYRYNPNWPQQPIAGMNNWPGSGGGISTLLFNANAINYNGYTFSAGFTYSAGAGKPLGLFLHEVAHSLYYAPHMWGNNGEIGKRFLVPTGWNMMVGLGHKTNWCANGWERWLLGWTDLQTGPTLDNSDINSAADLNVTGDYVLRDFVTTGDAIRLKIPYTTRDYIWLENHQSISIFDHNPMRGQAPSTGGEIIPDMDKGLYMYNEAIWNDRSTYNPLTFVLDPDMVNGLRTINAQGNFDYTHPATAPPTNGNEYFGANLFTFNKGNPNPVAGTNPLNFFRDDYNNPPQNANTFNGSIDYGSSANTGNNESFPIIRETNGSFTNMLYGNTGGTNNQAINNFGRRSDAFQVNDWLNIGSNPTLTNYPLYDLANNRMQPTVLSGISVKVLTQYPNGDIRVKIEYGYPDVNNNVRWCGIVDLNDVNPNGYDVNLKSGNTITIDKSGIPNRHSTAPFINPTLFICKSASSFHIESNANIIVQNESVLKLESGSLLRLEAGAILRIKTGCKLILDPNSSLENNGGQIIIEDGATLEYKEANISLLTVNSTLEIAGLLDLKTPAFGSYNTFTFQGLGKIIFNSAQIPANNLVCGNNCKIDIASNSAFLRVLQDKLRIPVGLTELHFTGGIVEIATNNAIEVMDANTVVNLFFVNFISSSYSYNSHKGLQLRGNPGMIHGCYFNFGYYGIVNAGGQLKVYNSSFSGCSYGIYAVGGSFYLSGNDFTSNTAFGIWASGMTQPSSMLGCTVQNTLTTNGIGVYYDGSLASPMYFTGNYIFNNKIGLHIKNATLSGECNHINNNTTYGMHITNGATVDFSGSPSSGYPQNDVSDNPISLYALGMKNLFIDNGYNDLTPSVSGIQKAIKGTIIRACYPPPATISTQFNSWNSNGTFSSSDYWLTTATGSKGCTLALPVTLSDPSPILYGGCGVQASTMMMASNPMYNCNTCDYIVTPNFYWEKLNAAGLEAMEKATVAGGNDYKESVRLFNEMLMYNINAPDAKEKYVLNYSYDKMGSAIGNAFLSEQITETENTLVLATEVQKSVDVQNKQIAEALNTGSYLDRYYASLDKVNTYRLAGRRDLAFGIIDDMFNWTQPDEMEYLNYKSCMTHLEQDFMDQLINYDEYIDAVMSCEQATNSLRVANSSPTIQTDNKKNEDRRSNELSQDNSITVSPNPATNVLSVYCSADRNLVVTLKDYLGRELFTGNMQNIIRIDCSKFSRGICSLQVIDKDGNRVANRKVVLQ